MYCANTILIEYNDSLVSLSGLDSLDHSVIEGLEISGNHSLSICSVKGICDYVSQPISYNIYIYDNAPGCNTLAEVHEGCITLNTKESGQSSLILVYPNPAASDITIFSGSDIVRGEISIYDVTGQRIMYLPENISAIDVSRLKEGIYIIEIFTGTKKFVKKLIIT
jgi:hypothetical protein